MDQGTQQNAAMVEESAAASHSLAKEAEALFELVQQFKVSPENSLSAVPHPRSVPVTSAGRSAGSPARELAVKLSTAFRGNAALAAEPWEEF